MSNCVECNTPQTCASVICPACLARLRGQKQPNDPPTKADRIRAMSDEELAEWILMEIPQIVEEPIWCDSRCENNCDHERECVKSWLQQPAPEEGRNYE